VICKNFVGFITNELGLQHEPRGEMMTLSANPFKKISKEV
jgi:hypothetical protein